jgi:predicted MFS family arabinose efflux permease
MTPLWRNREYLLLFGGQFVSTLGSSISAIVYPLLVLELTNSPGAAGIAAALRALPYVFFSLPAGALIDRWDRRRVMLLCDLGRALGLITIPIAIWFNVLSVWQLYIVAFIEGSLFVFFNIAEVAAIPRVVPKKQLTDATAVNQAGYGIAAIVGPPTGTILFETFGRAAPFILDTVTFLISVVSLALLRTPLQTERAATKTHLRADIVEGIQWLRGQPLILFMALLTGGYHFVFSGETLIIIVLAKAMGGGDGEIGFIFSIAGIGGILGSIVGGALAKRLTFGQAIVGVTWLSALFYPFYAVAPSIAALAAILTLINFISPLYDIKQYSHRLSVIPDRLQGRVNSTWRLIAFGFDPLGAAVSGALLEWVGPLPTIAFFALWQLGLALVSTANTHVRNAPAISATVAAD